MTITYRRMTAADEAAVLALWSDVFGISYDYEAQRLASDPLRFETTFVAADPSGHILSSAHYRLHLRRNAVGRILRVGELDPVATHPSAQRQGHAQHLVSLAIDAMESDGCDWSLLLTSEAARPLYERMGYHTFPMRYRRGAISAAEPAPRTPYHVEALPPQMMTTLWPHLARIHTSFNAYRPLTVVRDAAYWETFVAPRLQYRIDHERLSILLAYADEAPQQPCGYLLAHFFDGAFLVIEAGVDTSHREAIAALFAAVRAEADSRNLVYGEIDLPEDHNIDRAVEQLFGPTLHLSGENTRLMARPIAKDLAPEDMRAIFTAPGKHYSILDHF